MLLHSSFPDFVLFLYVHMSQADKNYDPNELAVIKSKMSRLFPEGTDLEQKLYSTIRQYNSFDKSKLEAVIKDSIKHFNKNGFEHVYSDIQDIIGADGQVDTSEARALAALKQIIEKQVK
jgi:uncharacterized tellurite resistance protein B-like protein